MSLYKVWEPAWGFAGELQSLSLTNLVAKRDKSVLWKCDQPGITLRDVPDAPATAETAPRRLRQMRAMADDFSAVLMDYRQNAKGERQTLRLLTKPLYRYSSPGAHVTDGAMFAFVLGTDAEVLLLLEARETKGASRWQYALARLNSDELVASFKEQEVWRVGRATYEERDKPYVFMSLSESPPPITANNGSHALRTMTRCQRRSIRQRNQEHGDDRAAAVAVGGFPDFELVASTLGRRLAAVAGDQARFRVARDGDHREVPRSRAARPVAAACRRGLCRAGGR